MPKFSFSDNIGDEVMRKIFLLQNDNLITIHIHIHTYYK